MKKFLLPMLLALAILFRPGQHGGHLRQLRAFVFNRCQAGRPLIKFPWQHFKR